MDNETETIIEMFKLPQESEKDLSNLAFGIKELLHRHTCV